MRGYDHDLRRSGFRWCAALAALVLGASSGLAAPDALPSEAVVAITDALRSGKEAAFDASLSASLAGDAIPTRNVERGHARATESALVSAVVASIARYPSATSAIVSAAVGAAPAHRAAIVEQASRAFPGFTSRIVDAAAHPAALPAIPPVTRSIAASSQLPSPAAPAPVAPSPPATVPSPAKAVTIDNPAPGGIERDYQRRWTFELGIGVIIEPDFPGADEVEANPLPLVEINWGNLLFISARDGVGFNFLRTRDLRLGLALSHAVGRDEDESDALRGLGDVDDSIDFGGIVEYDIFGDWRLMGRVRQDIFGGHEGLLVDAGLGYRRRLGEKFGLTLNAGATWASDNYMEAFFGIDARQSANSGIPAFDADAGVRDVNFGGILRYDVTENWFMQAYFSLAFLLGDAADSPISQSDTQATGGVGVGYRF